jgi:hypothetical protein
MNEHASAAETPRFCLGPFGVLSRFRANWTPVRVKKARQDNRVEIGSDSSRTDQALAGEFVFSIVTIVVGRPFGAMTAKIPPAWP